MSTDRLDMQSPDLVNSNFEKLAELFPNCVTESADGKAIDFDLLKQELNHAVVEGTKERYRLEWPGKKEAIVTANIPTTKTLRPVREDSVDFDNTENIYIEGDNLEVLKLLQESYLGRIKMIYIDPPYNTGKDFVYKDNFTGDATIELFESGQKDEYNQRLVTNPETSGRYHSDWLSMMYPRLKLARNLLKDDGVIFISMDDHEVHNLRKICDEIFGEFNFIENYIWESTFRPDNSSKLFRENAQHVLAYCKNINSLTRLIGDVSGSDGLPSLTKNSMQPKALLFPKNKVTFLIEDGIYPKGILDSGYELLDDVEVSNGTNISSFRLFGRMIWGQDNLNKELDQGTEIIIKTRGMVPYTKKVEPSILAPNTIIPSSKVGDVLEGRAEVSHLIGSAIFDYPKPVSLVRYLISNLDYKKNDDAIILDFFSGSGTTANAVYNHNAKTNNSYKFILVQLPEKTSPESNALNAGYANICEIGKERIRRASKKIKDETGANIDYGFRVYRLDDSNMRDVYYRPQDYKQDTLDIFADNVKPDRTADDLLAHVMLDWGLPLSLKIEQVAISGKNVYKVAGDSLYACFDHGIDEEFAKEIAKDKPLRIVFRDSGFASDTAKVNMKQLLKQLSPETEMKVF
jgi:adenine-specific DNA-methyltransferase